MNQATGDAPKPFLTDTQLSISLVCREVETILIEKNRAYGDSAIDPVRIFSSADPREQLLVRIDDKLSRISRGAELGEDVILDLIGYLVLLRVHDRRPAPGDVVEVADPDDADRGRLLAEGDLDAPHQRDWIGRDPRRSED